MCDLTIAVRDGKMNGKEVWICHFNKPDMNKKALRNVPPTKCLVVSNDELPNGKTVYYSESHYRPLTANGLASSKVISPVDNTGFRSYCGNMLYTFDNEDDCIKAWAEMVGEYIARLEDRKSGIVQSIQNEIDEMKKLV